MTTLAIISIICLQLSLGWGVPIAQQGVPAYGNQLGNRFPFFSFPDLNAPNFGMPGYGQNAAFAGAALTPGFQQQVAAISPGNPANPNVNEVQQFSQDPSKPHMYRVSSSSYASSINNNGVRQDHRGAHTLVDRDGQVSEYTVNN